MIIPPSTDRDEEQADLLLQLSANATSPDKGLHQLAGNYLALAQGIQNNSSNNINNFALPPSPSTTAYQATSGGQFDDAPETIDPRLLQQFSPSLMAPAPVSFANQSHPNSLVSAALWNQQGQQRLQQLQQRQTRDMQVQWESAARQAHLSMMMQQQERDFYLAMASNPTNRQRQGASLMLPENQPVQPQAHVGGKRQSQAVAAIRRAKAQKTLAPQQLPMLNLQQNVFHAPGFPQANLLNLSSNGPTPNGIFLPATSMLSSPSSSAAHNMPVQNRMVAATANRNTAPASNVGIQPDRKLQTPPAGLAPAAKPGKPLSLARAPADDAMMVSLPKPDADSWMHNMDAVHPSPLIRLTEQDNETVPVMFQAVASDIETKRVPIPRDAITRYDVLAGRGGKTNSHEGNIVFRHLVAKYKKEYLCAKKFVKRNLVCKIVHFVRQGHGRFLQRDSKDGHYYEIGDERAYAKLSQSMREGTSVASICREFASKDTHFVQQMMSQNQKRHAKKRTSTAATIVSAPVPAPAAVSVPMLEALQSLERQSPSCSGSPTSSLPFRKRWS